MVIRKNFSALLVSAGLLAVVLISSGCAPQLDRIEIGVLENRNEIDSLEASNKRIGQEVQALAELIRTGDKSTFTDYEALIGPVPEAG